jgi:hypothetical protein
LNAIVRKEDIGELGPAMRALPNDRWRAFVSFYVFGTITNSRKNNFGVQAESARKAGFGGPKTKPSAMAHIAWRIMSDDRMIAAIAEESRKLLRSGAPEAVKAARNGVHDPTHKDHARFVAMVLDRTDPLESHQTIDVIHKHIDRDQEEIEELRAARELGATREKLLELFGGNRLARLEALEAADTAQRARDAKVIEGESIEVAPEQQGNEHG